MTPYFRILAALLTGSLAATASAHVGPLDPTFGSGGMANYGFDPVNGGAHDQAVVGCPNADGTFTATGIASSNNSIVTLRLLPNGSYDPSYGAGGRVRVNLPGSPNDFVPGLCQPDGNMVMVRAVTGSGGEQDLQVLRVLKHNGQLDAAGFGSGGLVHIDLDTYFPGQLGTQEMPLGVNALSNGEIAVTGQATLVNGGRRGFVVLLTSTGKVQDVNVLDAAYESATTAVDAPASSGSPDRNLWVFGKQLDYAGAYRVTLDRQTLEPIGSPTLATYNPSSVITLGSGRLVDAETVVLPVAVENMSPGVRPSALLFVFHRDEGRFVPLPSATFSGSFLEPLQTAGHQAVTVLPGRRVLMAASAKIAGATTNSGIYLGMARIGRTANGNRPESGFVGGPSQSAAFEPPSPTCFGGGVSHKISRLTVWLGMPALLGSVDAPCGDTGGVDYLAARIRPDYLFADGMD